MVLLSGLVGKSEMQVGGRGRQVDPTMGVMSYAINYGISIPLETLSLSFSTLLILIGHLIYALA